MEYRKYFHREDEVGCNSSGLLGYSFSQFFDWNIGMSRYSLNKYAESKVENVMKVMPFL